MGGPHTTLPQVHFFAKYSSGGVGPTSGALWVYLLLAYYGKYLNTTLRIGNRMAAKGDGHIILLQI